MTWEEGVQKGPMLGYVISEQPLIGYMGGLKTVFRRKKLDLIYQHDIDFEFKVCKIF